MPVKKTKKGTKKSGGNKADQPLVPFDQIDEIVDFLERRGLEEFEFERDGLRVRLKRQGSTPVVVAAGAAVPSVGAAPATTDAPAESETAAGDSDEGLHIVVSPIVGTFYEAARPGSPAFVKVGDQVTKGQTLCIVEAMKLMNEIESDVDGEIVRIHGENSQPVEYGTPLFAIRPK